MAGLGILLAGLSGAGKALGSSIEADREADRRKELMREQSRLEEEKMLRIEEARRVATRAAGVRQGQEINTAAGLLQAQRNQSDADRINAENANVIGGSNMTAADAATLRNAPPEARKAYGLLASTRQSNLEDRATAEENLGYDSTHTRNLLQTELTNQRNQNIDESTNRRLDMEEKRFDAQEKRAQQQLSAQISHWKSIESKAGGDPSTQTLAKLKLAEFQMQSQWHAELSKTPVGSPERAALIQKGRDYEWIKETKEVNDEVTTSVKSINEKGDEITTTTKGRAQPTKSSKTGWDSTSGDVYQNGKKIGTAKNEADARRMVAGGVPVASITETVKNPMEKQPKVTEAPRARSTAEIRGRIETRDQIIGRGKTKTQYKNPRTGAWFDSMEEATKGL